MTSLFLSEENYVSPLARMWNEEPTKSSLIENIIEDRKEKAKGESFSTKITERQIIEQYFKLQLQVGDDDKMRCLIHQIGLEKTDLQKIQEIIAESKKTQLKWSAGFTLGSYVFYRLILAKRKTFYNFFNKNYRYPILGHIKRGLSFFMLFVFQVNILNYGFDKSIPNEFLQAGLYRKYHVEYEKVYL